MRKKPKSLEEISLNHKIQQYSNYKNKPSN
jgi:hypothetical protein